MPAAHTHLVGTSKAMQKTWSGRTAETIYFLTYFQAFFLKAISFRPLTTKWTKHWTTRADEGQCQVMLLIIRGSRSSSIRPTLIESLVFGQELWQYQAETVCARTIMPALQIPASFLDLMRVRGDACSCLRWGRSILCNASVWQPSFGE